MAAKRGRGRTSQVEKISKVIPQMARPRVRLKSEVSRREDSVTTPRVAAKLRILEVTEGIPARGDT